jgi:hypothetical protein
MEIRMQNNLKPDRGITAIINGEVHEFGSEEEFLAFSNQRAEAMDAAVEHWQRALRPGEHFVSRPYETMPLDAHTVFVQYGRLSYRKGPHANEPIAECFSVACPEGETGPVHLSTIARKLTRAEFDAARIAGWPGAPRKR